MSSKFKFLFAIVLGGLAMAGCSGDDGADGTSCTVTDNGDGTMDLVCGDSTVVVSSGTDGVDGSSCTAVDNGDGTYTITCEDGTEVVVSDGADGDDGDDGAAGLDGDSCTVEDNEDGTYTIACEDGSEVVVFDGADGLSCTVEDNGDGTSTIACEDGSEVVISDGADGEDGEDGLGIQIADVHGSDYLLNIGEFVEAGKYFADITIDAASVDEEGLVTVEFTVLDDFGDPVAGIASVNFNVVALVPAEDGGLGRNYWLPYIYRTETVSGSSFPNPDGTTAQQAYRENNGTLTDHGDGTYTYVSNVNLETAEVGGELVGYDETRTHRVSLMIGGHAGATDDAVFDFVPDGSDVSETRDIVPTAVCLNCHGENDFAGHGGDRLTVENCVTCHTRYGETNGNVDANSGESIDLPVMLHMIHMGGELPGVAGEDGNPWTPEDNDWPYAIFGHRNSRHSWEHAEFPAVIDNCTTCHQGEGADVDNWFANPNRDACGSCHRDTDFATGEGHGPGDGIAQENDDNCAGCHNDSIAPRVTTAHAWYEHDPRNIPEFEVEMSVSNPANGQFFQGSEQPVITIRLTDAETGVALNHTTIAQDSSAEGCAEGAEECPARDGLFRNAYLFLQGPRAHRMPVLSELAHASVIGTDGPFNLSAPGAALDVTVDGGISIYTANDRNGRPSFPGTFSVPVSGGTFANTAAASAAEVVAWLNANASFASRAIAWLDDGNVAVRSRNLGNTFTIQLGGVVADEVFDGDTSVHYAGGSGSYPNIVFYKHTNPADDEPGVAWYTDRVEITAEAVRDLAPGTYVASVEIADGGRISATNYRTPSVAWVTFQVGQASEELPVAGNCDRCHQNGDGLGFVLDYSRHNKLFGDDAVDQCGACHDYQTRSAAPGWDGGRPISRRVHAVHNGSNLNYPLVTVDYSNGDPVTGRNWNIVFPQDIRNCQTCHPDGDSSGTWATHASRLPCSGCHDSDAAMVHMTLETNDPTPLAPWSGDEQESCNNCH